MSETFKQLTSNQYLVTYTVRAKQHGTRLDQFLMLRYRRRSREQLKKAIDSGAVTVVREGKHRTVGKIKASFSLLSGDLVKVQSIRKPEPVVNFDYKILYEDDAILVIHKPPNLPVHPAGRFFFNTLLTHLQTDGFSKDLETSRSFYLVHRIDKETSGVLLIAKTREACNLLTAQFRDRLTDKYYLAIVKGKPTEPQFDIKTSIGKIQGSRIGLKMYSVPVEQGGLEAQTHFEWIETRTGSLGTYSLMACFPRTGRQHQIRVHAEIAGYPLVGDKIYGMTDDEVLTLLDGHRTDLDDSDAEADTEKTDYSFDSSESFEEAEMVDSGDTEEAPTRRKDEGDRFEIPGPTLSRYAELEAKLLIPRHALHAAGLRFKHPTTGKDMVFEADLPNDLAEFFANLTGEKLQPFRTKHW